MFTFPACIGDDEIDFNLYTGNLVKASKFVKDSVAKPDASRFIACTHFDSTTFERFFDWMTDPRQDIKMPEKEMWCSNIVDVFVLAIQLEIVGFLRKMLKLFVKSWVQYHALPNVASITKIYDPDDHKQSGAGSRKLLVDLIVWESDARWLSKNKRELKKTEAGRAFLENLADRTFELNKNSCIKGEGPFLFDLRMYHVDVFERVAQGTVDLTGDDD